MIKISIQRSQNHVIAFSSKGHAEYSEGDDIVCAAVSTLVINTANAIEQLTDTDFSSTMDNNEIKYIFHSNPDEKSKLLMDALVLGLKEIQKEYGKKYLNLVIYTLLGRCFHGS